MKWIRNILKGLSLTTALFVFQACYGTPPARYQEPEEEEVVEVVDTDVEAAEETAGAEAQ